MQTATSTPEQPETAGSGGPRLTFNARGLAAAVKAAVRAADLMNIEPGDGRGTPRQLRIGTRRTAGGTERTGYIGVYGSGLSPVFVRVDAPGPGTKDAEPKAAWYETSETLIAQAAAADGALPLPAAVTAEAACPDGSAADRDRCSLKIACGPITVETAGRRGSDVEAGEPEKLRYISRRHVGIPVADLREHLAGTDAADSGFWIDIRTENIRGMIGPRVDVVAEVSGSVYRGHVADAGASIPSGPEASEEEEAAARVSLFVPGRAAAVLLDPEGIFNDRLSVGIRTDKANNSGRITQVNESAVVGWTNEAAPVRLQRAEQPMRTDEGSVDILFDAGALKAAARLEQAAAVQRGGYPETGVLDLNIRQGGAAGFAAKYEGVIELSGGSAAIEVPTYIKLGTADILAWPLDNDARKHWQRGLLRLHLAGGTPGQPGTASGRAVDLMDGPRGGRRLETFAR